MTKSVEVITNGLNTFELNREIPKVQMWKLAQEAGFEGGRTSFYEMLNGNVETVRGYSIKVQVVVEEVKVAAVHMTVEEKVAVLNSFSFPTHVVTAKAKTYATVAVKCGRFQIDPLANNLFGIMLYPKKGYSMEDCAAIAGGEIKNQYVKFRKLSAAQVTELVAALS